MRIQCEIMAGVKGRIDKRATNDGLDAMFMNQGFSFDAMFEEAAAWFVSIEPNVFGARSGCGASLFHWLRNKNVLNGRAQEGASKKARQVEFRVSV